MIDRLRRLLARTSDQSPRLAQEGDATTVAKTSAGADPSGSARVPYVFDTKKWNVHRHRSLDAFLGDPALSDGYHAITEGPDDLPLVLLSEDRGFDTTVAFLHGARPEGYTLPFIAGLGVSQSAPVNRVCFSDPTLALGEELRLAWFAGNRLQDLQSMLTQVARSVFKRLGTERPVFFGTSGGGLATLFYASAFAGSIAMATNPQTSIEKYYGRSVERYMRIAWDEAWESGQALPLPEGVVTAASDIYREKVDTTVVYFQNAKDDFHLKNHMRPFLDACHPENEVWILLGVWGDGHARPPKELYVAAMDAIAAPDFRAELEKLGFTRWSKGMDVMDAAARVVEAEAGVEERAKNPALAPRSFPLTLNVGRRGATEHESLASFLSQNSLSSGYHVIHSSDGAPPIVILNEYRKSDTTLVVFSGARQPGQPVPYLPQESFTRDVRANRILISDPTLSLDPSIKIGWYVGNRQQVLLPVLEDVIRTVFETHSKSKRLVFLGGTGGALPALYFAHRFPGSGALLWNPQTDIQRYRAPHVVEWARTVFGAEWAPGQALPVPSGMQTSVVDMYRTPSESTVYVLQNDDDDHHITEHLLPLIEAAGGTAGIAVHMGSWGRGNAFPDRSFMREALDALIAGDSVWFEDEDFYPASDPATPDLIRLALERAKAPAQTPLERYRFDQRFPLNHHESMDRFLSAPGIPNGYHLIPGEEDALPVAILTDDRGFDTTMVFLHGAIPPAYELPFFTGTGVSEGSEVNRIAFSDPSLAVDYALRLGWFAGNRHQPVQDVVTELTERIVSGWGSSRTAFFGTSGGGFATLYFSSRFPGSIAMTTNPQTNIERYYPHHIRSYVEHGWGEEWVEGEPLPLPDSVTSDLTTVYSERVDNTIVYFQNATDEFHLVNHMQPFFERFHPENEAWILFGNWGDGHARPPKDLYIEALDALTADDFRAALAELGFVRWSPGMDILAEAARVAGSESDG